MSSVRLTSFNFIFILRLDIASGIVCFGGHFPQLPMLPHVGFISLLYVYSRPPTSPMPASTVYSAIVSDTHQLRIPSWSGSRERHVTRGEPLDPRFQLAGRPPQFRLAPSITLFGEVKFVDFSTTRNKFGGDSVPAIRVTSPLVTASRNGRRKENPRKSP